MKFTGRGILLDIEGTMAPIGFVYDVMFPFVRRELDNYLETNWNSTELNDVCDQIAIDTGYKSFIDWCGNEKDEAECRQLVRDEVIRLMDDDVKVTGLKKLQGLIWRSGFESGEMLAHIYDDVPAAIEKWNNAGYDVRIYSSGSIESQKLFFRHTIFGDLLHLLRDHYDTTTGSKWSVSSYRTIAKDFKLPPEEILFLSDVPVELNAAQIAGLQTGLCKRPGNAEVLDNHGHIEITSFDQVQYL